MLYVPPIIGVVTRISPTKAAQQDNDNENYQYEFHELYRIKPSALPGRAADWTLSEEVSRRVTDGRDKKVRSFAPWARATHSAKRGYPGSMYHMIKCWAEAAASPIRFSDSGENFAS
jgi:hypothetical protein